MSAALAWTQGQDFNGDGWRWSWSATLHQLRTAFGAQLTLACLVVVVALALAVAVRGRAPWRGLNPPSAVLAAGSAAVVAACTLTPRSGFLHVHGQVQLIPFHTVLEYANLHSPSQLLVFIGGNVVLFAPLGFFTYLAAPRTIGRAVAVCAGVSVTVELVQLTMASRTTDVDDVMTNTLGGLLGALAAYAVLRLVRSRAAASVSGRAASPWPP